MVGLFGLGKFRNTVEGSAERFYTKFRLKRWRKFEHSMH
jgi:hypothetical protein